MNWLENIVEALESLGGSGRYEDIYERVEIIIGNDKPESWKAIVRQTIQSNSSDSTTFNERNDLFYSVEGIGNGYWGLREFIPNEKTVDFTEDDIGFPEGKNRLVQHVLRERNNDLVNIAKRRFKEENERVFCEVCGFDFEEKYGEIGRDFIEAHHIIPISQIKSERETRVEDLLMVCSNCHKMLHRRRPWLSRADLEKLIKS